MITSIGAERADAADEPTPPHLAVDDAAATSTANNNNNNNNNEREQIPRGEEHAAVSSSSSLLLSSSATISMPSVALPEVAAVAVVEADDHRQQQQQSPYEKAIAHAATLQSELFTLLSQKSQLESSAISEWSTKISNYESQSLREMNDELQLLQNVQAEERKVLEEKLRLENEMEEHKLTKSLVELKEAMDVRRRESKKRCRGKFTDDGKGTNGEEGEGKAKKKSSRSDEKEKELEVRLICCHFIIIIILSFALIQRHTLIIVHH
jgi:hypothetical protein